jgi:hypothetical protein
MLTGEVSLLTGVGVEVEQLRLGDPLDQAAPPAGARKIRGARADEFDVVRRALGLELEQGEVIDAGHGQKR